jgi:hypothetical protein
VEKEANMQRLYFLSLIFFFLLLTACSISTDFYIVNESNYPIEVEYRVKVHPNNPILQDVPTKIAASQLESRNGSGRYLEKLSDDQYRYDKETGIVNVRVLPREALWISSISGYGGFSNQTAEYFYIKEIAIKGTGGEVIHTNRQVLDAFSKISDTLYALTYR